MSRIDDAKLIAHLTEKWGVNSQCPMCKGQEFSVGDRAYQLTEYHQGNLVMGGPVVPLVPIVCTNCGNTLLVNAILSGVVALVKPPTPKVADTVVKP
jgi:hypothetical protein